MMLNKELLSKFEGSMSNNILLSNYSWFNLGGPAEYLFKPKDKNQLIEFLEFNKKLRYNLTIIGAGSNTLIRDKGIKGVVIKLGSSFSNVDLIDNRTIEAGAGTLDRKISNFARDNEIGNFEFLSCIPGSIGGAVIMNSGCYGYDISKVLLSLNVIDIKKCEEKEIKHNEIDFFYRGTNLPKEYIITSVKLKGENQSKEKIESKQNEFMQRKKMSQPSKIKTCGSTFKNLNSNQKAWQIIKQSGCDEFEEGGAKISKQHCNFFVNNGNAKSADIEKLIKKLGKPLTIKWELILN